MKPSLVVPYSLAAFVLTASGIAKAQNEALPITIRANAQAKEASPAVAMAKRATVLIDTLDDIGSGFCIDESGVFVTNAHVVEGKIRARVVINSGEANQKAFIARVTHRDEKNDLAVLVIDSALNQGQIVPPLTALPLGDSDNLFETLPIAVFGFPYGTGLALDDHEMPAVTVTTGRVTALRKRQGVLKEVQLDAATNPGNSGGPVIDNDGKVVGIVYAGIDGAQGLNFAIPVAILRSLLAMPEVRFDPPEVPYEELQKNVSWKVEIVPFAKFAKANAAGEMDYDLSSSLNTGGLWRDMSVSGARTNASGTTEFRVSGTLFGPDGPRNVRPRFRLIVRQNNKTILTTEGFIWGAAINGVAAPNRQAPTETPDAPIQNPANGHWYQCIRGMISGDDAITAAEAMTYRGFKGHLATISSSAEGNFIASRLLGNLSTWDASAWIGGVQKPNSVEPDGGWQWITGEPLRYANWAAGEPNHAGNENMMQIRADTSWNDANAMIPAAGFVVEFESPESTIQTPKITDAPQIEGDRTTINLSSPITDVVSGGGGRFLLLYLKADQKIAVFDAEAKKIARYIPASGDKVFVAASQDKLVLLLADQNILQRWNLQTGVREQSVPLPDDQGIRSMALGSASNGPLLIVRDQQLLFLNLATLQKIEITDTVTNQPLSISFKGIANAAPDGSAFSISRDDGPRQSQILELDGNRVTQHQLGANVPGAIPSFDGHWWFSSAGIFSSDGKPVIADQLRSGNRYLTMIPAYSSSYFVVIQANDLPGTVNRGGPVSFTIYSDNDRRALTNASPLDEISTPQNSNGLAFGSFANRGRNASVAVLPIEKRVHYLPDHKLLLTIANGYDQLIIRQIDLKALMSQNGEKYFFIASTPPRQATKGSTFKYQIDTQSQADDVKYNFESGPEGLTLTPTGLITWNVPADFGSGEVTILISVSNGSGQELYHSIKVQIK